MVYQEKIFRIICTDCKADLGMASGAIKLDQLSAKSTAAGTSLSQARADCCQGESEWFLHQKVSSHITPVPQPQ